MKWIGSKSKRACDKKKLPRKHGAELKLHFFHKNPVAFISFSVPQGQQKKMRYRRDGLLTVCGKQL